MEQTLTLALSPDETAWFERAIDDLLSEIEAIDTRIRSHQNELGRLKKDGFSTKDQLSNLA